MSRAPLNGLNGERESASKAAPTSALAGFADILLRRWRGRKNAGLKFRP